jgi:basic membrane protein A
MLTLAFNIRPVTAEGGTIYIRADGSIDPPSASIARNGDVYTFSGDIYASIVVERNRIVIDGNGHLLQGGKLDSGITLTNRTYVTIKNMRINNFFDGIWGYNCSNNFISRNILTSCDIFLDGSSNNTIIEDDVVDSLNSIWLAGCSDNNISGNRIGANSIRALWLEASSKNVISGNNITATNGDGIWVTDSAGGYSIDNTISENDLIANGCGIKFSQGNSNNKVYHNNFFNNARQVITDGSSNLWDDGYPSGGNYWSDYTGVDLKSGPNQDLSGSDGIGDTPYIIDADNRDRYPLMTSAREIKIGLILATGGLGDKSFNDVAYAGMMRAKAELNITFDYAQPAAIADYESMQRGYASDGGYTLIVCIGFDQADALNKTASAYPNQKFAIVDTVVDQPNVASLLFRANEGSFLTGVLAGMLTNTGKVGFVGGIDMPFIRDYYVGYKAGAEWANSTVTVLHPLFVGGWSDPNRGKELALTLIGLGADGIFHAAGKSGLGALLACHESGVNGFGADSCQDFLEPEIKGSMTKRVDNAVFDIVKAAVISELLPNLQEGGFEGGVHSGGVAENWVGCSRLPEEEGFWEQTFRFLETPLPANVVTKLVEARDKITSGNASATFAIITDLHIGRGYPNYNGEDYYLTDRLQKVAKWISDNAAADNIKFVVVLGDLTEDGTQAEMLKAKETLDGLGQIPYFPVIGNHDHSSTLTGTGQDDEYFDSVFNTTFFNIQHAKLGAGCTRWVDRRMTLWNYRPVVHLENYAFQYQGKNFVFLDFVDRLTNLGMPTLETDTMDFLRGELNRAEPTILFSHHPMIESKANFHLGIRDDTWTDLNGNITSANAKVLANFAGHIHGYYDPQKPLFVPRDFGDAEKALLWQEANELDTVDSSPYFYNASYNYKGSQFPTAGDIPVITTEAMMVGSNTNAKNGIVRIVRVTENSLETWTPEETAFPSLNPYIQRFELTASNPSRWLHEVTVKFVVYAFARMFTNNSPINYSLYVDGAFRENESSYTGERVVFENQILTYGSHEVNLTVSGNDAEGRPVIESIKRKLTTKWNSLRLDCPADILITDSAGHKIGKQVNEIPGAIYTEVDLDQDGELEKLVLIPAPIEGDYALTLTGTGVGTYSMIGQFGTFDNVASFNATEIPVSLGAIHQYSINCTTLSRGEEGVTIQVDSNGDGIFESALTSDVELNNSEFLANQHQATDFNADGKVDNYDAIVLANAFGSIPGDPNWNPSADLKSDSIVDVFDAIILGTKYGKTA